jgi:hypothetical protein
MNNQSYRGYGFSRSVRDVVNKSPREQYELAVQNFVPQNPGRKGWHVTPARRQYNTKRTEQLRSTRGRETMKQVTEALDSKLAVGMKEIEDALNQIEANKTLVAVTTLVTTRTMGFCAAQIYFQASAQRNPVFCNIYSFYRVNLAMFEARLYHIRSSQEAPIQMMDEVEAVPVRPDFFLVTQTVNAYPDQVGRVIKTAGAFIDGNEYFVPALSCSHRDREGRLILQSERIILSNLRETVTAPEVREVFYQNNPIPGAIWNELPDHSHVLVNPDEIIPAEYTSDDLRDDINDYSRMMTWLQKKIPKYVKTERLNYKEKGDRSIFVSNFQN